jgi:hypothetical protein
MILPLIQFIDFTWLRFIFKFLINSKLEIVYFSAGTQPNS